MFTEIQNFTPQNQAGAKCSFCGQHAREREGHVARKFRTPLHIHLEGWVEVCEWCIIEAATKVGMILREEAEELEALRDSAVEHGEKLLHDLEDARSSIRVLSQSLAVEAEDHASKLKQAYERGYDQATADAKAEVPA